MKTNIKLNIASSLILQIVSSLCSLLLPQLFVPAYGSEIYGAITTITQVMGFLGLLEAGVGSVAYVALYHALSEGSNEKLLIVRNTIQWYYHKVAVISLVLCLGLSIVLPFLLDDGRDFSFNLELCLIIGCGHFVQYYFGITNQLLLNADFKGYINSLSSLLVTILNCTVIYFLINAGCGVLTVKFVSAFIFFLRPIILNVYVRKNYSLLQENKDIDSSLLAQRWNNLGQTIAFYLHNQTDVVLIMLFLSVSENSVYGLYAGIVSAIKMIINVVMNNYTSIVGRACSGDEADEKIKGLFGKFCSINNFFTNTLFSVLCILFIPFMRIYTKTFVDYCYVRPIFAYLMCLTEFVYLMRFPYNTLINVKGHFKETQFAAYTEAGINLVLSVIFIQQFGIVGCMLGTLVAMLFRYVYSVVYVKRKLLNIQKATYVKTMAEIILNIVITICAIGFVDFSYMNNYLHFFISGVIIIVLVGLTNALIHFILFKENIFKIINYKAI